MSGIFHVDDVFQIEGSAQCVVVGPVQGKVSVGDALFVSSLGHAVPILSIERFEQGKPVLYDTVSDTIAALKIDAQTSDLAKGDDLDVKDASGLQCAATRNTAKDANAPLYLRCSMCSGAMVVNQARGVFECPFCGNAEALTNENYYQAPPIRYRHRPIEFKDDLLSVLHTEPLTNTPIESNLLGRRTHTRSMREFANALDGEDHFDVKSIVHITCAQCGADISGEEHQSIFECQYCGNKVTGADALRHGSYSKRHILGRTGLKNVPGKAIAFSVTTDRAINSAIALASSIPELGNVADLPAHIRANLEPFYMPFSLGDVSVQAETGGFMGKQFYQVIIDWPFPETTLFDVYLTDRLEPWDFSATGSFDPAFMEGDAQIASTLNSLDRPTVLDSLLFSRLSRDVANAMGKDRVSLNRWGFDWRRHNDAYLLLPIYYADVHLFGETYVTVAVNGQTGKAAILALPSKKENGTVYEGAPRYWNRFSSESTMANVPVQIKHQKGSMKWVRIVR